MKKEGYDCLEEMLRKQSLLLVMFVFFLAVHFRFHVPLHWRF